MLFDRNLLTSHSDKGNYQSLCGTNYLCKELTINTKVFLRFACFSTI